MEKILLAFVAIAVLSSRKNIVGQIHNSYKKGLDQCRDGTFTDSWGHGSCSYHGGVALSLSKSKPKQRERGEQLTLF